MCIVRSLDAINYSSNNFIRSIIYDEDTESSKTIQQVISAFLLKHPEIGYDVSMIQFVLFLLCLGTEA